MLVWKHSKAFGETAIKAKGVSAVVIIEVATVRDLVLFVGFVNQMRLVDSFLLDFEEFLCSLLRMV